MFLTHPAEELLYGGAAGGGKSVGILAAGLQYVDHPGYHALILRRTFPMLEQPGGLIPMSKEWLMGRAKWNESKHRWHFPSGASLSFGFLDTFNDVYNYQGGQHQFIGFEELTQFAEPMYQYLFSRLRKAMILNVPIRMRGTSNPGGVGHAWVRKRFGIAGFRPVRIVDAVKQIDRAFIPAKLDDNPGLDRAAYRRQLAQLDDVTRQQLEHGDWDVAQDDNVFDLAALIEMEKHVAAGVAGMLTEVR